MEQTMRQGPGSRTLSDAQSALVSSFMRRIYNWMTMGLALSGLVAWWVISSPEVLSMFVAYDGPTGLFWGALVLELVLVFGLSAGIRRISVGLAMGLFVGYSALNGVTLAPLLLIYTGASVMQVFFITAGTFIATSIWATVTKKDLSAWGSFLFMGLIGIIIASVVNIFFQSPMVTWVVSIIGVGIFVGLTAYDTQKFRAMVLEAANETTVSKMAVIGALSLYLDFINMFIMLLRLLGNRE